MSMKIVEISNKSVYYTGTALRSVIAVELKLDEDGEEKYLTATWVSSVKDVIKIEMCDESILELLDPNADEEKLLELSHIRERSLGKFDEFWLQFELFKEYGEQVEKIKSLLVERIKENETFDSEEAYAEFVNKLRMEI